MNIAEISEAGQVTIPFEIRRLLGLKAGDKVSFDKNINGEIMLSNASANAISKIQKAFIGAAENLGLNDDSDVQNLVYSVRYGKDSY